MLLGVDVELLAALLSTGRELRLRWSLLDSDAGSSGLDLLPKHILKAKGAERRDKGNLLDLVAVRLA